MKLSSVYDPHAVESKWYQVWEEKGYFKPDPDAKETFTIVIPPPNVTGILHMGHALNNTLQDTLVRFNRMQGKAALWVPGTDHAGIATQNVVERKLAKENITRHDLGRDAFIKHVWDWKEEHGSTIVRQLRKLGSSCDWSRERFTMDEGLSEAVQTTFLKLYEEGLIYRGYYLVNWCPRCQTALSDEEVEHKDEGGTLTYIRYPAEDGSGEVIVATTRPETLLGDTGVAVHPEDERFTALHGKNVVLPLLNRKIPIIQDKIVDREFGTGAVKVTPAHDPNDFMMGQTHDLQAIRVMAQDGTMNEQAGPYAGLDRFECRKKIVEDLEAQGFLVKVEPYNHSVGHCYRCATAVEPALSPQWFVRMEPLAKLGLEAIDEDGMRFLPDRWTGVYRHWLNNIRDWCISRQIWWGHRIPAWYCQTCYPEALEKQTEGKLSGNLEMDPTTSGIFVGPNPPEKCGQCGGTGWEQDEDVLDTWFSSWLWPFSTLGWPEKTEDLERFYPTSVLVTGQDIIFFWVARMVMAGKFFMKRIPFKDVAIHGIIRVEGGQKMSKSLGNVMDPLDIIEKMGADGMRFSIAHMTSEGQDLYLSENKFLLGRNFANKIWNAARFILESQETQPEALDLSALPESLTLPDQWILSELQNTIADVTRKLEAYHFNEAARLLYAFFWNHYCDWYVEIAKLQRNAEDTQIQENTECVLWTVLETFLRLLHPIMPFITEEIWHTMGASAGEDDTISRATWPVVEEAARNATALDQFGLLQALVVEIRNIRSTFRVPPKDKIQLLIRAEQDDAAFFEKYGAVIERLAGVASIEVQSEVQRPGNSVVSYVRNWDVVVPLEGLVDLDAERQRIQGEIDKAESRAKGKRQRLSNPKFTENAPEDVVAQERALLEELEQELAQWSESLKQME